MDMSMEKIKLAAAWVLLAGAASLLRFKTVLQSDSLFLDSLFTDLFTHGGRWADWKFIQAPAFLPDMLLYLLAYPLFPDAASRIFFVSAAQVPLLAAAVLWCARQIHPQLSRQAQTVLLLMLAFVTLVAARSNMWLYFYSTNNHLGATLFGLLGVGLLVRQLARPSRRGAVLLVLLIAAAQVSTRLFLLSFVLPLTALLALALVALPRGVDALRRHRQQAWNLLGVVLASQLLAAAPRRTRYRPRSSCSCRRPAPPFHRITAGPRRWRSRCCWRCCTWGWPRCARWRWRPTSAAGRCAGCDRTTRPASARGRAARRAGVLAPPPRCCPWRCRWAWPARCSRPASST